MAKALTSDTYTRERTLAEEITPLVETRFPGVEVLAVELLSPSRFCVYIDKSEGVDLALCEAVTRTLDHYRADWAIDVSSPGPERPLRKPSHFRDAMGRPAQLKTAIEIAGKKRFRGDIVEADDTAVTVAIDGEALRIPVEHIVRGNLIDEGR